MCPKRDTLTLISYLRTKANNFHKKNMNCPTLMHIHAKTNLFNTWKMDISKHDKNQLQIKCKK